MRSIKLILLLTTSILASCKIEKSVIRDPSEYKNVELKKDLERIVLMDQGIREIVDGNVSEERKADLLRKMDLEESDIQGNKVFSVMREIDSLNLVQVENIIESHGYPWKA